MEQAAEQSDRSKDPSLPLLRRRLPLLLVTLAAPALFLMMTDGGWSLAAFRRIHPLSVLAAVLLAIVPWFTDAARSALWCRFLGRPVPYSRLLRIAAAAEVGAAVAPPFVGTVPVKTVLLSREGCSDGEALAITTLASLSDWVFYLIAAPCCLAIAGTAVLPGMQVALPDVARAALWAAGCGSAVFLIAYEVRRRRRKSPDRSPGWTWLDRPVRWCTRTWRDLAGVYRLAARRGAATFLLALFLTAVQWGCRYSVPAVLIGGMGLPSQPALFFALQILLYGLTTIVPTPGGAGGAEALFALLHSPHLPGETLGVATVAWRVVSFYLPVLLASATIFLLLPHARRSTGPADNAAAQTPPA